jgi:hypothetical protein
MLQYSVTDVKNNIVVVGSMSLLWTAAFAILSVAVMTTEIEVMG